MIPWSATMSSTLTLYCVFGTWLVISTGAITVSIDRSDLKPAPTQSSMIANGWRPLASSYEDTIGTNVSPSSNLERNAPLHPVLGKYQEHMSTSEKQKPSRKTKPTSHHDYNPPSILGSFTLLGHAAAKSRPEVPAQSSPNKYLHSETQEYTFLIPPPKNTYRFEVDQQRKPVFRENGGYPRPPQYVQQQVHHDPHRAASYFIKGYVDNSNTPNNHNHPSPQSSSKNRPFVTSYVIPQQLFQPPRHEATPFESLKLNSAKPYHQPPGSNPANDFTKNKQNEQDHRQNYETFKPPPPPSSAHHNPHAISPSGTGNYYSQVNHPSQRYKPSYERNPSFLVHESHEISYVTPPGVYSGYNIGPSTPYETLLPPEIYSSPPTAAITSSTAAASTTTNSPRLHEPGKFVQSNELVRTDHEYKQNRPGNSAVKQPDNGLHTSVFPGGGIPGTYYVSEHQDLTPPPASWPISPNKYTSDINEVLPRVNPPTKFSSADAVRSPHEQQHYQSSVTPTAAQQQTNQPEYETPESISLKHFNEQQYLLQQQLIQRDRQRLAEQERQQQLEIEKQQREELRRRQEELKKLLEKEEEEGKLQEETLKIKNQPLVQVLPDKVMDGQMPYTIQLAQYEMPKVTIPTEPAIHLSSPSTYGEQPVSQYSQTIQPISEISTNFENINQQLQLQQQIEHHEPEPEVRPYRPQKPSRDQYRRRKPTTMNYDVPPATDIPTQLPETLSPVTPFSEEVSSIYTTPTPETLTVPATIPTQRPRVRRPGIPGRRRRPTTTTTEESITVQTFDEDFLKYERPEQQQQHTPDNRRRRVKPTSASNNPETVTEKRPNIRKRPGHRVRINPGEPFDAEIVTEVVHTPVNSHRETFNNYNNYEGNVELTSQPIDKFTEYTSVQSPEEHTEDTNETSQHKYQQENTRTTADTYNDNEEYRNQQQNFNTDSSIPLEEFFGRTDGNYVERITTESSTSTTTTTTSTTTSPPPTQSTQVSVSTTKSLKIRPLRYGNNTRPRFSIKDYKTRMDYKNKIAGMSTTEASTNQQVKQRQNGSTKLQQVQQQGEQPPKESNGRYKYVSRGNYRTSTTAATTISEKDNQQTGLEDNSSTTEKPSRFVPKRRPNGNIYRSRVSNNNNVRHQQHTENESSTKSSTARPENVFSSSIRRRPIMKNKLHINRSNYQQSNYQQNEKKEYAEVPTEMTAEETSFYSPMTTSSPRIGNNEVETVTAQETDPQQSEEKTANASEINEFEKLLKPEDDDTHDTGREDTSNNDTDVNSHTDKVPTENSDNISEGSTSEGSSRVSDDSNSNSERTKVSEESNKVNTPSTAEENTGSPENGGSYHHEAVNFNEQISESTTKFDIRSDEEELFAKASQSVADLTSSASALYDKPGMFKAVSPESRVVSPHFKITTDEPTLPIEAFFQELSKKN